MKYFYAFAARKKCLLAALLLFSFSSYQRAAHAHQCVKLINPSTSATVEWYSLREPNNFRFEANPIERTITPKTEADSEPVQTQEIPAGSGNPIVCSHTAWEDQAVVVRFNGAADINLFLQNTINVSIGLLCGECALIKDYLMPLIESDDHGFTFGRAARFKSGVQDKDIAYVGIPERYRALTIAGGIKGPYTAGAENLRTPPIPPDKKYKTLEEYEKLVAEARLDPVSPPYHVESARADLADYKVSNNAYHPGEPGHVVPNVTVQACAAMCSNNVFSLVSKPGKCVGFNYVLHNGGKGLHGAGLRTCQLYTSPASEVCGVQKANVVKPEVVSYYERGRSQPVPEQCNKRPGE